MSSSAPNRKLSDERTLHRLAAELRSGVPRSEALRRIGVSGSTFYRELRRSPELRALIDGTSVAQGANDAERRDATGEARRAGGGKARSGKVDGLKAKGQKAKGPTAKGPTAKGSKAKDQRARDPKGSKADGAPAPEPRTERPQAPAGNLRARAGGRKAAPAPPARQSEPTGRRTSGRASGGPAATTRGAQRVRGRRPASEPAERASATPEVDVEVTAPVDVPVTAAASAPEARWAGLTGLLRRPTPLPVATPSDLAQQVSTADQGAATGRRSLTAPSGADWIPPVAVLALQLLVAIAVGASPLVILLVAITTTVVLLAVQRARRIAPRRGYVAGVRYSETLFVPDSGANGSQPTGSQPANAVGAAPPAPAGGNGRLAGPNGHPAARPGEERRADLDWVAASILRGPASPDEPPPPRRRG